MVGNQVVIEEVKDILSQSFCCYGNENVRGKLRKQGYRINEKKFYRQNNTDQVNFL